MILGVTGGTSPKENWILKSQCQKEAVVSFCFSKVMDCTKLQAGFFVWFGFVGCFSECVCVGFVVFGCCVFLFWFCVFFLSYSVADVWFCSVFLFIYRHLYGTHRHSIWANLLSFLVSSN